MISNQAVFINSQGLAFYIKRMYFLCIYANAMNHGNAVSNMAESISSNVL